MEPPRKRKETGQLSPIDAGNQKPSTFRACEACARKKTRCDMRRPVCSLCDRIKARCVYPTYRKKPPYRKDQLSRTNPTSAADIKRTGAATRAQETATTNGIFNMVDATMQILTETQPAHSLTSSLQSHDFFRTEPLSANALTSDFSQSAQHGLFFDIPFSPMDIGHQNFVSTPFSEVENAGNRDQALHPVPPISDELMPFDDSISVNSQSVENTYSASGASNGTSSQSNHNQSPYGGSQSGFVAEMHKRDGILFSIDIPEEVGENLLELYFDKVQPSFPLLFRPKILDEFITNTPNGGQRFRQLDFDSALLLNSIFALAARFSEMDEFWSCKPSLRGDRFGKTAQILFDMAGREEGDDHLSLKYLQGCILYTYFQLTSRPSFQAWVAIGFCCRIASALSLHQVDRDSGDPTSADEISAKEWTDKEERRRAWWTIVQMDNFASFIGGRPANIDMSRTDVLLPVSDEEWFKSRPMRSAFLRKEPANGWSSLIDGENQDAYAWFLIANSLCRAAQEEFEKRERSKDGLSIVQSAIQCYLLCLPPQLRLRKGDMAFTEYNAREKNWVMAIHFIIHSAKVAVGLGFQDENLKQHGNERKELVVTEITSPETSIASPGQQHVQMLDDQLQAVRVWPPDYLILATPLIANALVIPAAAYSNNSELLSSGHTKQVLSALDGTLLEMVLRRFSEYWGIGSFCLDLLQAVKSSEPNEAMKSRGLRVTWAQSTVQRANYLKSRPAELSG